MFAEARPTRLSKQKWGAPLKAPSLKEGHTIHDAAINGGRVVYTGDFESSGLTLADFIEKRFFEPNGAS